MTDGRGEGPAGAPGRGARDRGAGMPIGIVLRPMGVDARWWLDAAVRLEAAGYDGVWCWDHFMSRGTRTTPVLEAWTMLAAAAAVTSRMTVGTFVMNVMNRHPSVVARMAATLQQVSGGRLVLGIGIGGNAAEHRALGIPFPDPAERVERLAEAVAVLRALWTGGPATRASAHYPLEEAWGHPVPEPAPPIIVGGETTAGARLAARIGDGWTAFTETFERDAPAYRAALEEHGRDRAMMTVIVGWQAPKGGRTLAETGWVREPAAELARWQALGADRAAVTARNEDEVRLLLEAAERW